MSSFYHKNILFYPITLKRQFFYIIFMENDKKLHFFDYKHHFLEKSRLLTIISYTHFFPVSIHSLQCLHCFYNHMLWYIIILYFDICFLYHYKSHQLKILEEINSILLYEINSILFYEINSILFIWLRTKNNPGLL